MLPFPSVSGLFISMPETSSSSRFFSLDPSHDTLPEFTLVFSRPQNQLIATRYESAINLQIFTLKGTMTTPTILIPPPPPPGFYSSMTRKRRLISYNFFCKLTN